MKKKILVLFLISMLTFTACTNGNTKDTEANSTTNENTASDVERKEYRSVYSQELGSINYLVSSMSAVTEFCFSSIDGLVDFDKYGVMKPNMAVSYEVSEDGLVYTFKLREGVKWYTYDKKEYDDVTAYDFVYGLKYVLTKDNASTMSNIVYNVIENAKEYYDGEITDFSQVGIKAIDKYTLQYTLKNPTPYFLSMSSYTCWLPLNQKFVEEVTPEMFGTSCETLLYNGAYIMTSWEHENKRIRELNMNYWDVDNMYISKITDVYNKEASTIQADLFLRNEISEAKIPIQLQDEWMNDPDKKKLLSRVPVSSFSNQYMFNYDPQYDEEYAPEDWKVAVNNLNFRKSLYHAVNRKILAVGLQPYDWENIMLSTVTVSGMFNVNGKDYTQLEPLADYTNKDSFDENIAVEFKEKAMKELDGKVQFPIKVVFPHTTNQDVVNRAQVFEQHMENVLGKDYIDIVLLSYPPTGFTKQTRAIGNFSLILAGWGPDYSDPSSYFEIYQSSSSVASYYGKTYMIEGDDGENGKKVFENLIDKANDEKLDVEKRMLLYAEAEKYILDNALSIPAYRSGGGFQTTYKDPFSGYCSQFGRSRTKLKGVKMLDKPMNIEEYDKAYEQWLKERDEAFKNADKYWK